MTDRLDFESRIEARLIARAAAAARPFDAVEIARHAAGATERPASVWIGWQALPRALRWSLLALALVASTIAAVVVGRPLLDPTPRPVTVTNGWVAFEVKGVDRQSDSNIWIGRPGSPDRLLIGYEGDRIVQGCPSFSPDGTLLAYARHPLDQTAVEGDLVVVRIDATTGEVGNERVPAPELGSGCPKWSPDGQRLAVALDGHIWVVGLDGTSREVFSSANSAERGTFDWSPTGNEIVVVEGAHALSAPRTISGSIEEGRITLSRVMVVPLDGGEPRVIHEGGADVSLYRPTWSPDGTRIIVEAARLVSVDEGYRLEALPPRIVAADGNAATSLLPDTDVDSPAWSPDGKRLAYHRTFVDGQGLTHREIVVTAFDGSDLLVLAVDARLIRGVLWSPDGRQVLYIADAYEGGSLVTVAASGDSPPTALGGPHLFYLTTEDAVSWQPVFVPGP